jgi:hypothetical protein
MGTATGIAIVSTVGSNDFDFFYITEPEIDVKRDIKSHL